MLASYRPALISHTDASSFLVPRFRFPTRVELRPQLSRSQPLPATPSHSHYPSSPLSHSPNIRRPSSSSPPFVPARCHCCRLSLMFNFPDRDTCLPRYVLYISCRCRCRCLCRCRSHLNSPPRNPWPPPDRIPGATYHVSCRIYCYVVGSASNRIVIVLSSPSSCISTFLS